MEPLVTSGIITDSECQTIFSNIKNLADINRVMASKLDERKAQTLDQGKDVGEMLVGDIFCEMVWAFSMHALTRDRRRSFQCINIIV